MNHFDNNTPPHQDSGWNNTDDESADTDGFNNTDTNFPSSWRLPLLQLPDEPPPPPTHAADPFSAANPSPYANDAPPPVGEDSNAALGEDSWYYTPDPSQYQAPTEGQGQPPTDYPYTPQPTQPADYNNYPPPPTQPADYNNYPPQPTQPADYNNYPPQPTQPAQPVEDDTNPPVDWGDLLAADAPSVAPEPVPAPAADVAVEDDIPRTGPLMWLICATPADKRGEVIPVTHDAVIGRKGDIRWPDPRTSRRHARFTLENQDMGDANSPLVFFIWPLESRHPTTVNGRAIRGATELHENDKIHIGDTDFIVKLLLD